MTYKLTIAGALGRMGQMITKCAIDSPYINHIIGLDQTIQHRQDVFDNVHYTDDPYEAIVDADIVIDFSSLNGLLSHSKLSAQAGACYMSGVTGITEEHEEALRLASRHIPVLWTSNTSLGVNIMHIIAENIAQMIQHHENEIDIEILEKHHRYKKDAPSGTAITLAKSITKGLQKNYDTIVHPPHHGASEGRQKGKIGFANIRGGDVIGEHQILFLSDMEVLELHHKATHRHLFAQGALKAGLWLHQKEKGLYHMRDFLGL